MSSYHVRFTEPARDDLLRLYERLLQRDPDLAAYGLYVIRDAMRLLEHFPETCHPAVGAPRGTRLRELPLPLGPSGWVALLTIEAPATVTLLAVRANPDGGR